MGCINSTKKLHEMCSDGSLHVRVVRLKPDSRNGWLELSPRELVFTSHGREPVIWALQHLRRYGLNGNIFSFEAGRRCMSGPGIYTFRCQQADRFYQLFQRYLNAVSAADDTFAFSEHPSHTLGRPDANPHANNYLEPAPLSTAQLRATMHESFSSSPLSLELDSPDSVPSFSFTNEVVHFQNHQHPATPVTIASSNVYLEQPLRPYQPAEHNNNKATTACASSAFNTLTRKAITKRASLDIPPDERAPMLLTGGGGISDALHMYANVEALGSGARERFCDKTYDPAERCYENLSRLDMPLLLQQPPMAQATHREVATLREPVAPAVNYIVLDLDQPRSPAQCSPKTYFGSSFSLSNERASTSMELLSPPPAISIATNNMNTTTTTTTTTAATTTNTIGTPTIQTTKQDETSAQQAQKTESSLGYSTIDFIKTCALIKSSTHGGDFDADHDELRITRHSKGVRKSYSISE